MLGVVLPVQPLGMIEMQILRLRVKLPFFMLLLLLLRGMPVVILPLFIVILILGIPFRLMLVKLLIYMLSELAN